MMAIETRFVNVSNPAALGIEVTTADSRFQLVMINGRPFFGMYRGDGWGPNDGWSSPIAIVAPERFGKNPRTYSELLAYAREFVAANYSD
jgi:hypothetical protein